MDYPCSKFGDFGLSRFVFIVRIDRHTDRITDSDDRYTDATTVGVSNKLVAWWTAQYRMNSFSI